MVIQGQFALPVGERVVKAILKDGRYHDLPFVVLRVATKAEYLASVAEQGLMDQYYPDSPVGPYFYEISVD